MKKGNYLFVGKAKNLLKDLQEEIESRFEEEIEQGLMENNFCDNTGFCCGTSCKNYYNCKG